ncbi:ORF1629 [Adoxophyes honmai nucleopolyhedrovirus]|uniref:ORF1629 n=1 Tax=Adoxophyes honmai nucleopolyhedrovirus TaxID=224399 RepID=Q80LU2_NPVAH|nr:ORF1629 [Adoxophyes honmai nucleopolyhedrovirus]BAC67255.1 ORF1629 [Adoxophyes honmai nucleopolyhedrovirus]
MLASNYLLNEPINELQDFFKLLKPNELQNKILNNNYSFNLQEALQLLQLANEIVDGKLVISQPPPPTNKIPVPKFSMPVSSAPLQSQLNKLPILKNIVSKVDSSFNEYKIQMTEILNNISLKQNVEENYKQFFIIYKQYLQNQKQCENIDKLFNKIVDLDNAIPLTRCPYPQEEIANDDNVKERPADANQESFIYSLEDFFVDKDKTTAPDNTAELQSKIIDPTDLYQTATEVFSIPFGVPPPPPPPPPMEADIMPAPPPPPPPLPSSQLPALTTPKEVPKNTDFDMNEHLKNIQKGVKLKAVEKSPPFAINKHLELIQKGVKLKKVTPVEKKVVETANTNSPMVVNALQKVLSSRYNALANSSSSEFDATDVSTDNEWYHELDEEQMKKQNKAKLYENLLENVVTDAKDKKKLKKLYKNKNAINNSLISKYGVKNNPILIDNTYIDLLNESNYVRLIQDLMLKNETALAKRKIDEAVALKPDSPLLLDMQKKIDDILTD